MIPLLLVYIQMFVATFIKSTVTFPCLLQQSYTNNLELFVATVTITKPGPQASGCSFKLLNICCSNDKPTFFPPSSGCCNTCCNLPLAIYPIILLLLQHLLPNLPGPGLPVATVPLLIIYLHNYLIHMLRIFIIFFYLSSGCCNTCCNLPLAIYPIILMLLQHLLPNLPGPGLPVATVP